MTIGLALCLPSLAGAEPVATVRYDRPPLPFPLSGFLSTAHRGTDVAGNFGDAGRSVGWRIHENFSFSTAESIREIHWGGLYLFENDRLSNPVEGTNTDRWELRIWSDSSGEPATALYTEVLDFDEVSSALDGTNEWRGVEIPRYVFGWELAEPFETESGVTYWVSILSIAAEFEPMFVVSEGFGGDQTRGAPEDPEVIAVAIESSSYLQRNLQDNILYARWGTQALTVLTTPLRDSDEDGMDDDWELMHGLSDTNDESGSDPDGDGLTCLEEFERRTHPNLADSDGDGLSDAVETNTGIFISATDRGSNPNRADTDGDGLDDGLEDPTKPYFKGRDSGSDPNLADTDRDSISDLDEMGAHTNPTLNDSDADGVLDAWELDHSTDPNDPADPASVAMTFPTGGATSQWNSDGELPATFNDYMGVLDTADVTFQLSVDFDEKPSGGREVIFETGGGTFGFSLVYEAGSKLVLRASGNEGRYLSVIERTLREAEIAAGAIQLTWAYDTMNVDGTQSIGLWVNGEVVSEVAKALGGDWSGGGDAHLGKASLEQGSLAGNGLNGNLIATDFVSGSIDLGEGLQMFHSRYPVVGAIERKDSDGDGMGDYLEDLYGLDRDRDDADLDLDGDTLSNIDEIDNGTLPNQMDSDADGLADNVETRTGTWMGAADTGTDPSDPDSDDDGLLDGVENPDLAYDSGNAARQPGSDPNVRDSDGDSVDDGLEVQLGSDPSNQGSTSSSLVVDLVSYWPLDGDLDDAVDDNHGTKRGSGAMPFVEGKLGGAVEMDGYDQYIEITGGDESEFDFAGGSMSISSWFKVDKFDTNWQAVAAKGEGLAWRLHRHSSGSQLAFSGGANSPSAGPVVNDGQWHHAVAVSEAGVNQRLYVDGVLVSTSSISPLANGDKRMRIGDNPDTENREWEGCIDEVAIWSRPLTEDEIATLWNGGEGTSLFGAVDEPLRIARIGFTDEAPTGLVEIAWVSKDSHVYAVERSFDLLAWEELDDSVEATGEFTSYIDEGLGEALPQRVYYRVLRIE